MESSVDDTLTTLADRLKQHRKNRQWTLEQLAQFSGVSRSMISQIERGQANPTLAIACRIAQALGISIGELVEQPWTQPAIEVVRGDDPQSLYRDDSDCQVQTLSPLQGDQSSEFYRIRLMVNGELNSAAHFRGTREMLTVHEGEVQLFAGNDSRTLKPGDTAHYAADQAHGIRNLSSGESTVYLVVCLPAGG